MAGWPTPDAGAKSDTFLLTQTDGARNSDALFYVIWREGGGFFSILSSVLGHLQIAERLGAIPVVDMQNFPSTYSDRAPVNGSLNAWTYYFEPVSDVDLDEVYESTNFLVCSGRHPGGVTTNMSTDVGLLTTFDKFIRLNAATQSHVDNVAADIHPDSRTLGVHYRGHEQRTAPAHPYPPTLGQVIPLVRKILDESDFDRIFLVTEGQEYLDAFKKAFGERLHYTEGARGYKKNAYLEYPRPLHMFHLGLEVLTDTLLLSTCGGIVSGNSNVSEAAILLSRGGYRVNYQIDLGLNSNRRFRARYLWSMKSLLPQRLGGFPSTLEWNARDIAS